MDRPRNAGQHGPEEEPGRFPDLPEIDWAWRRLRLPFFSPGWRIFPEEWSPAVDLFETEDAVIVKVDLPGTRADQVQVSVEGHTLAISGSRVEEAHTRGARFYRRERRSGHFSHRLALPANADLTSIDVKHEQGVLEIRVPLRREERREREAP
jgi:HSP20 family protein